MKSITDSIEAGPATAHNRTNPYEAYVVFIRNGKKYAVCEVRADIAKLNGPTPEFLLSEIQPYLEYVGVEE